MNQLRITAWAALALTTITVATGYNASDGPLAASIVTLPLLVWIIGTYQKNESLKNAAFMLFVVLIAIGTFRDQPTFPQLIAMLSAFVMWDIDAFAGRMAKLDLNQQTEHMQRRDQLIRQHLLAVTATVVGGLLLALITFNATLQIGFWVAVLLGIILTLGLTQALKYLRESDL